MKIAIMDFITSEITIIKLSKEVEKKIKEDKDFSLYDYVTSLPGFNRFKMAFMTSLGNQSDLIKIRIGDQSDFPEFNMNLKDYKAVND